VPGRITEERAHLEVFATVLGGGRTSRLYEDFVFDRQVATRAVAYVEEHQLASQFHIDVTLNPGEDVAAASARIDEIVSQLLAEGPTADELAAARTRMNAGTIRGLEQIGGFGGKAVALAEGQLYAGDPGFWRTHLERMNTASAAAITATAREWLNTGSHQITVMPFGDFASVERMPTARPCRLSPPRPNWSGPKSRRQNCPMASTSSSYAVMRFRSWKCRWCSMPAMPLTAPKAARSASTPS
jgi:zinc protease